MSHQDTRLDDWSNTLSKMGSLQDKSTGLQFSRRRRLTRAQIDALYEQNPICARIRDRGSGGRGRR
jgi:hypothetical protein